MATRAVVITSPLSGRTIVRAPYRADMRGRLRACGAEPHWEDDSAVWTMPRHILINIAAALEAVFPSVRVDVELTPDRWRSFRPQDLIPVLV